MVLAIDVVKNMVTSFGGDEAWDTLLGLMVNTPDMLTEPYSTEIKVRYHNRKC